MAFAKGLIKQLRAKIEEKSNRTTFLTDKCARLERQVGRLDSEIVRLNELVQKIKKEKGISRRGFHTTRLDFREGEEDD